MKKYAYVSGITNDAFLPGLLVMFKSLKKVRNNVDIDNVCFVTAGVSHSARDRIRKESILLYEAPVIDVDTNDRWKTTFQKICIFNMTEYDKIVWIDADMMVTRCIDYLFDKPHMSAVMTRAPYKFINGKGIYSMNSGLMVIEPNEDEYHSICNRIAPVVDEFCSLGKPVGDQNVLNDYYSEWHREKERHLDDGLNVFWGSIDNYHNNGYSIYGEGKPISVIHYTGGAQALE